MGSLETGPSGFEEDYIWDLKIVVRAVSSGKISSLNQNDGRKL